MKQYDSKYDIEWEVKTQDAIAREEKCLKMQAFKDLLLLFVLRGHKVCYVYDNALFFHRIQEIWRKMIKVSKF